LRPLYWLANYLAMGGTPLRAGMIVTTGSYCGAVNVPIDTPLTFAYGDLGTLSRVIWGTSSLRLRCRGAGRRPRLGFSRRPLELYRERQRQ
jgi:hypothetical protein